MLFREKQQIAVCVAAVAMVFGFVLFRYLPLRKKIKTVKAAQVRQEFAVTKASAENQRLPKAKEQLLQLKMAVGNYQANVPVQRDLGEFLQKITNLMNEHNLKEQLIQPGRELKTGELNCVPISVQCKGRLKLLFEFYKSLQGLDRLVRFEYAKLVNDRDFSGEVSIQTKAAIYYRTETGQGNI